MKPIVESALRAAQERLDERQRNEYIDLALFYNLYEREYAPDGKFSEAYPFFSKSENPPRYFRKIPLALTSDEYQALRTMKAQMAAMPAVAETPRGAGGGEENHSLPTSLSTVFNGLGALVIIAGLVFCFVASSGGAFAYLGRTMQAMAVAGIITACAIQAFFLFAISKIISLLNAIAFNTRKR
jgi:hypothetical protein